LKAPFPKCVSLIFNITFALVFREEEHHGDETESGHESFANVKPDIQELEMLLEAYFVQVDGTLNKLCHVCSISFYSLLVIGLIGCVYKTDCYFI
jgi:protein-arginine kinase activator protein McsA